MEGKGGRSDIQVTASWENEVMGTESDKKVLWKLNRKSFMHK